MEKTNTIIEILVVGLIAFLGITINIIGFLSIDATFIKKILIDLKGYSNILLIIILAISYQLGWLVNNIAKDILPKIFFEKVYRATDVASHEDYEMMRDKVYLIGSSSSIAKIKEQLSAKRLLRAGNINMFILFIGFLSLGWFKVAIVCIFILILFIVATYNFHKDYVKRISNMYTHLEKKGSTRKK